MNYFEEAFEEVLLVEKGFVNSKYDRGGKTKYGITQKTYPNLDIENLTIEDAKAIYKQDFWDIKRLSLGRIKDRTIAIEVFDTAVNMGPGRAGKILQVALNNMNRNERLYADLTVDGYLGTITFNALDKILNKGEIKPLMKVLNGEQYSWYKNIIDNDKTQEMNFVGWMKRV